MKKFTAILFILLQSVVAFAGSVNFTAKVSSNTAEVGQRFQITFTINSNAGNFRPPSFKDFGLLSGPNQGQSMQYVNGQVSRTTSISYILHAVNEGTFTIGAAQIEVDGKVYKTEPIKIEVSAASQNSANAQRNRQNQRKENGQNLNEYVFVRAFVDKSNVYVGEKVTATFKLYSRLTLNGGMNVEKLSALNGFWSQDVKSIYDQITLSQENIDGVRYQVAELQQIILYPQRSGELVIDPLEIKVGVQVKTNRRRSAMEQFFGGGYDNKEVITGSKPIKINVSPLPSKGKPANFSGAVGNFNMSFKASKDSIKANEAINVTLVIDGQGNLPLIGAPTLKFPPDFEVYDPETADNFKTTYSGSKGSKVYSYLVIPRHSGNFKIEPYEFVYFDIASKSYKTIRSNPLQIKVGKGSEQENVTYSPARKEEVKMLNKDIRYIHINDLMLVAAADQFYDSALFYCLIVLALLLALAFYFLLKLRKNKRADQVGLRKSKANKLAKKRLATAKKHLDGNDRRSFYEEISTALHGYFADKFNISLAELSQEKILEILGNDAETESIRLEVSKVLEEAEMARFAADSEVNAQALYDLAVEIISKTESLER